MIPRQSSTMLSATALLLCVSAAYTAEPRDVAKQIDQHLARPLADKKMPVSPVADDAEFVRRVYLDITGRIPTFEQAQAFLDSKEADKRTKLIDELLTKPEYGLYFAGLWRDRIVGRTSDERGVREGYSYEFVTWLADGINKGKGWDELVSDIIIAQGEAKKIPSTLMILNNRMGAFPKPEDIAGVTAKLFMGTQLRCAQCHNHPYVKEWKQDDFWGMAAFFGQLRDVNTGNDGSAQNPTFSESPNADEKKEKSYIGRLKREGLAPEAGPRIGIPKLDDPTKVLRVVNAKLFHGDEPKFEEKEPYRPAFAKWLTSTQNPFFARATSNRMWQHFFARALVEPVDDMRPDQPGLHPELLTLLENELKGAKFDQRHLIRCICNSEAYQRTSKPLKDNAADFELFSHQAIRPMNPDQMLDSLSIAIGRTVTLGKNRDRPTEVYASKDADADPTEFAHGIPQFLFQMNASQATTVPAIANKLNTMKTEEAVEALFLAALTRKPKPAEMEKVLAYIKKTDKPGDGYRDLFWVLLNSAEFMLVH